jgi:hypothetical protein
VRSNSAESPDELPTAFLVIVAARIWGPCDGSGFLRRALGALTSPHQDRASIEPATLGLRRTLAATREADPPLRNWAREIQRARFRSELGWLQFEVAKEAGTESDRMGLAQPSRAAVGSTPAGSRSISRRYWSAITNLMAALIEYRSVRRLGSMPGVRQRRARLPWNRGEACPRRAPANRTENSAISGMVTRPSLLVWCRCDGVNFTLWADHDGPGR